MTDNDLPTDEDFNAVLSELGQRSRPAQDLLPEQIRANQEYMGGYLTGLLQAERISYETWARLMARMKLPAEVDNSLKQ